jgi:hypothetical protein
VQVEDRRTDLPHGLVELLDGLLDAPLHVRIAGASEGALQLQAGGEEPLDDVVVQVAGDSPFDTAFQSIAGAWWADWLFMLGLAGIASPSPSASLYGSAPSPAR